MPRTKQPKLSKKNKKALNSSAEDSSLISNTSGHSSLVTFKSTREVVKAVDKWREERFKRMEDFVKLKIKELGEEFRTEMVNCPNKHLLKTLTVGDLMDVAKRTEEDPEYKESMTGYLMGTCVPTFPGLNSKDQNKTASSSKSAASSIRSVPRPPSSASSHSSRTGFLRPGSSNRSRSVTKAPYHLGSGMKRRSMSQPNSVKSTAKMPLSYLNPNIGRTPIITPKVQPDSRTTVLRLPKTGESMFSLSGSPILPNASASTIAAPHTMIPMRGGNVMAIMPGVEGQNIEPMEFSPETTRQLRLLKHNLNQLIPN